MGGKGGGGEMNIKRRQGSPATENKQARSFGEDVMKRSVSFPEGRSGPERKSSPRSFFSARIPPTAISENQKLAIDMPPEPHRRSTAPEQKLKPHFDSAYTGSLLNDDDEDDRVSVLGGMGGV